MHPVYGTAGSFGGNQLNVDIGKTYSTDSQGNIVRHTAPISKEDMWFACAEIKREIEKVHSMAPSLTSLDDAQWEQGEQVNRGLEDAQDLTKSEGSLPGWTLKVCSQDDCRADPEKTNVSVLYGRTTPWLGVAPEMDLSQRVYINCISDIPPDSQVGRLLKAKLNGVNSTEGDW